MEQTNNCNKSNSQNADIKGNFIINMDYFNNNIANNDKLDDTSTIRKNDFKPGRKLKLNSSHQSNEKVEFKLNTVEEKMKVLFPSYTNEKIEEILKESSYNLEKGIELIKNINARSNKNNTVKRRRTYNEALQKSNLHGNTFKKETIKMNIDNTKPISNSSDLPINNLNIQTNITNNITINDKEPQPSPIIISPNDVNEEMKNVETANNTITINNNIVENNNNLQSIPNKIESEICTSSSNNDIATLQNSNDITNNLKDPDDEKGDKIIYGLCKKLNSDINKLNSKESLYNYLKNSFSQINKVHTEFKAKSAELIDVLCNITKLEKNIADNYNKLKEYQKDNMDKEQKIEEVQSSIGNLTTTLSERRILKNYYMAQLNDIQYSRRNINIKNEGC